MTLHFICIGWPRSKAIRLLGFLGSRRPFHDKLKSVFSLEDLSDYYRGERYRVLYPKNPCDFTTDDPWGPFFLMLWSCCWRAVTCLLDVLLEWLRLVLVLWQDMTTSSRCDLVLKTHSVKSYKFRGLGLKHLTILYFCTLAWKIPWTEEPGRLQSMGSQRLHFHFYALEKEMATHSSVLAWRIPGTGQPGGLCLWGRTVRQDWSDLAAAAAAADITSSEVRVWGPTWHLYKLLAAWLHTLKFSVICRTLIYIISFIHIMNLILSTLND